MIVSDKFGEHPKYTIAKITESKMWSIESECGRLLCEIHLGKWTPGKYSVRTVAGLGTFVAKDADTVLEVDTLKEAAELAEVFFHCNIPSFVVPISKPEKEAIFAEIRAMMHTIRVTHAITVEN